MAPLDNLYSEGASKRFAKALPGKPEVEQTAVVDGSVRINVYWNDAHMKIECTPDEVRYVALSTKKPAEGLYSKLCDSLPPLFRDLGVTAFTATAGGAAAREVLMRRGEWEPQAGTDLRWEL